MNRCLIGEGRYFLLLYSVTLRYYVIALLRYVTALLRYFLLFCCYKCSKIQYPRYEKKYSLISDNSRLLKTERYAKE